MNRPLIILSLAGAAVAGLAFLGGGSSDTHTVTARFTDADGLVAGNEVRVAGVPAGTVQSITVGGDPSTGPYAEVVLSIDAAHWPLHQGTRIAVRPQGVLSNVFVDLTPGAQGAPAIPAGHLFGTNATTSPVNLDQLTDVFNGDTRTAIRTQLQEGVIALGGTGASDLNAVIAQLDPLTNALLPITNVLAQRSPELDRLNAEFDTITTKLASENKALSGLVANGNVLLTALAAKQHELQGTLDHAAGALGSLDAGLQGEQGNLASIFQKGPGALDRLEQTAAVLAPLINAVDPHIPHLDMLLDEFVSGTGFGINGIDTLRVDAVLNQPGHSAQSCGGQHTNTSGEQKGCPFTPSYHLGSSDAGSGSATEAGASGAGGGDGGSFDLAGMFG
ncbi:MAG: MCE family protein [Chloroflexi bacterium]|nr:MAG: MCE family protein [Chloroflexota bacterium]